MSRPVGRFDPKTTFCSIGLSRTVLLLLCKAHLGEVSVTVWPKALKDADARKNILVLE